MDRETVRPALHSIPPFHAGIHTDSHGRIHQVGLCEQNQRTLCPIYTGQGYSDDHE